MEYYVKIYGHGDDNFKKVLNWLEKANLSDNFKQEVDNDNNMVTIAIEHDDLGQNTGVFNPVINGVFVPTIEEAQNRDDKERQPNEPPFPMMPTDHAHKSDNENDHSNDFYACHFIFGDEERGDYDIPQSIMMANGQNL